MLGIKALKALEERVKALEKKHPTVLGWCTLCHTGQIRATDYGFACHRCYAPALITFKQSERRMNPR